MPNRLTSCNNGDKVKIVSIDAGRGARLNLMNLGLNIGNTIQVARKSHLRGPIMVNHQGTEIAIGFGLAQKITVEGL